MLKLSMHILYPIRSLPVKIIYKEETCETRYHCGDEPAY